MTNELERTLLGPYRQLNRIDCGSILSRSKPHMPSVQIHVWQEEALRNQLSTVTQLIVAELVG